MAKKTTTGAKIGKKRKTVAHSQEHQSAVLLCDFLCSSLVPCCPLLLVTFLVPSYNCANTILGYQLGQVLWIFTQHCYLFLTCVPHIHTYFVLSQAPPSLEQNRYSFAITPTLDVLSHRPPSATCSAGKNLVRAG